jgi:hypothetical protein
MSGSTPDDLAVAFRSFPRRLREALEESRDDPGKQAAAQPLVRRLEEVVDGAAARLGVAGADLNARCQALAERIEAVPADKWDDADLDALREAASEGGKYLRQISQLASS